MYTEHRIMYGCGANGNKQPPTTVIYITTKIHNCNKFQMDFNLDSQANNFFKS